MVHDDAGVVAYANQSALDLLGMPPRRLRLSTNGTSIMAECALVDH